MNDFLQSHSTKLLGSMPVVKSFEGRLASLNDWWGKITLIGKINSHNVATTILDDMSRTQLKFGELQKQLTHNLLVENVQKLVLDNSSKAQVAIDLLIRNLFERTADVGFLATDDDIRVFLGSANVSTEQTQFIENRLREYVKKYSVYDEIIVFDTQGNVKAHLDKANSISYSNDPLLAATLKSDQDYVETFRYSDLQSERRHSLIYSCKITQTDDKSSPVLGVLCLCFRFDDEMHSIFDGLLMSGDIGVLAIIDRDGQVIASSNEHLLPLNTGFKGDAGLRMLNYRRQDYIVNMRSTNGYQGFYGLGWRGQMMTGLGMAFGREERQLSRNSYTEIMHQASSFPQELREIHQASSDINTDLGLLVLNGQIASARKNATEFMPVLEAIRQIGSDITAIFNASVKSLQEVTVMSSHLNNAGFLASLAVDIMDRNLYERANDCRWWALTSAFRRGLTNAELSFTEARQISEILQYINALYTVYTNLYLYDSHGRILAVSSPQYQMLVGVKLDESTGATETLKHSDSQHYTVSAFDKTHLYGNRHTYIYNAAITDLEDPRKVLGGIGIVFDSEPQFESMLNDVLPRDKQGKVLAGCFGVFAQRNKTIIAVANNPALKVGDTLEVDAAFFGLKTGHRSSEVIQLNGTSYIFGVAVSKGYREYKVQDGYRNDVIAMVFIPF
ncbi:cache domain-containing protein [Methylomonas sp. MO1]|uniref:cache domain-containing protein n=1 Tax=Methylomonas sp. MO1 TaxID=3073619 RepID=UPI0028A30E47|nr:cache domain-containing protein [Methylomonas sp. MO1]MDT4288853.1 cache domain-containing protein [Methylomonas sp. MO1]